MFLRSLVLILTLVFSFNFYGEDPTEKEEEECFSNYFWFPQENFSNCNNNNVCKFFQTKYIADVIDRGFQEYFTLENSNSKIHRNIELEVNKKITPPHIWENLAIRSCYFNSRISFTRISFKGKTIVSDIKNINTTGSWKSLYKSPYSNSNIDLVNDITYSILVDKDIKNSLVDKKDNFVDLQKSSLGNASNKLEKEKKQECADKGVENLKEILLINEKKKNYVNLNFKFECELDGKKYNYDKDVKINFDRRKNVKSSGDVSLSNLLLKTENLKSIDLLEAVSLAKAKNQKLKFIKLENYDFGLIFNSYTKLPYLVLKDNDNYKIHKEPLRPKVVKENEANTDSKNIENYCNNVMNNEGFDINLFYAKSFLGNMPFELELDEEKAFPSTKLTEEIRNNCLTLNLKYGKTKYKGYLDVLSKDLRKMSQLIKKAKRKEESRTSEESDIKISLDDLKKVKSFYDFMESLGLENPDETSASQIYNLLLSNLYAADNDEIDELFNKSIVTSTDLKRQLQNVIKMEDFLKKFSDKNIVKHPNEDYFTRNALNLITRNATNYISPPSSSSSSGSSSGSTSGSGSGSGNGKFWETAGKIGGGLVTAAPVLATGFMSVWGMFQEVKMQQRQYDMELLKLQMAANPCFSMKYEIKEKEETDKMLGINYKYDSVEYEERSDYNVKMDNMFNPLTGKMESLSPYEMCVLNAIAGENQNPFMQCYQLSSMKMMGGPVTNKDIKDCFRAAAGLDPLKGPGGLSYNAPGGPKDPGGDDKEEDKKEEEKKKDDKAASPKAAGGAGGSGTTRNTPQGGNNRDREIEGMLSPGRFSRGYGGYNSNTKGNYQDYKPGTSKAEEKGRINVEKDLGKVQVNILGLDKQVNNHRTIYRGF
jgi:hypothetical protein